MTMKVTYPSAKEFSDLINVLTSAVDEAAFEFTKNGFRVRALDPSRVMFIQVEIPASSFEEYNAEDEKVGVNLQFLGKVLKRAKKNDKLHLEENDNMIKITLDGGAKRTFKMGTIDVDTEDIELPEIDYTAHATVDGKELFEAVKDASMISDAVKFKVDGSSLIIMATGSTNDVKIEIEDVAEGQGEASYGISYLIDILKGLKNGEVTIHFGDGLPVLMEVQNDNGKVSVLLAPRVEE